MECAETNLKQSPVDKIEVEKNDSADNFQKFIYDLFDKNGILNDLRAYLRGHIVNVLKSAQTDAPPLCQKHFTQRLELVSQALNILIAEYLLQLDFTYTLSVFVSEIPLSNMVFDFAKALLKDSSVAPNLKFKDGDVWSVLNYLGVKCDSEHAMNIVEMYKNEERVSLLFCILKCMPMYHKESVCIDEENSCHDSITSSAISLDTLEKKAKVQRNRSCHPNCKHYTYCKSCQNRMSRLKEKYRETKKDVYKESKNSNVNPLIVENFMKNINAMEKRIINEMFEELHSVYEAEVDLVRQEEESRLRRTLATHALQLQQRREEIEETLKTKEAELESSTQHKKQFLWSVARALREQHEHVARAMTLLKNEQEVLTQKENNMKTQLLQAEETLRNKGEEMRVQISKELEILEGHLESMKKERDSLNKERFDLEYLKSLCDSKSKIIETHSEREKEDLKQHCDVLKEEIDVLKKYIESTKAAPKCVIEKSTITEFAEVPLNASILNNTTCLESDANDREVRPPNQLVNDLKKQKNVNFSQSNRDERYREISREASRCSLSSDDEPARSSESGNVRERDTIQRLMEENESLKDYARQQREHISALWCERARSSSAPRPRTAPALLPATNYFTVHRVNPSSSANTFGWRKGAGEELSLFSAEPPTLLPGDPIPFVGILRDRHTDNRRYLINQWRALKRRSSPLSRINNLRPPVPIQREKGQHEATAPTEPAAAVLPALRIADDPQTNYVRTHTRQEVQRSNHQEASPTSKAKAREKSPKTVLKEAKQNLRNKNSIKEKTPLQKQDKSPNSMLREAKLRLRKLEIEAEAVEKSYLNFRKRQADLREERQSLSMLDGHLNTDIVKNLDVSRNRSFQKFCNNETEATIASKQTDDVTADFDKYLCGYQTKFNIGETYFKNKNTAREKAKPIPIAYSEVKPKNDKGKNIDYLATPMMEFRKLYHAEKERNLPQLRSNTAVKSGVAKIYDQSQVIEINEDSSNVIHNKAEQKNPEDNVNTQNVHNLKNATEIRNTSYEEINIDENVSYDMQADKKSIHYVSDFEAKLECDEKSNAEDLIQYKNLVTLREIKRNKTAELEILKENINKIYNFTSPQFNVTSVEERLDDVSLHGNLLQKQEDNSKNRECDDKNVLRVEVESLYEVNKVKMSESQEGEIVVVVQSSVTTKESDESDAEATENIPMSVNISPKERTEPKEWEIDRVEEIPKSKRSDSPEKAAQLTRNDALNAIFHADDNKTVSSIDMRLELSKNNVKEDISDPEKEPYGDYPDDFSADVDNYNSHSDYGNNSPISLPKSDNDNFWDN